MITATEPFHLLAKPTGAVCNLDCDYCFFLSKEMLYPDSDFRMSETVLGAYVTQLIEAHAGQPEVQIAWQGGEPTLMGLEFFEHAVALAERAAEPGQTLVHTIQTNGTKIDAAWAEFFKRKDFLVGVSIDGPQAIHDAYRVTKGGRGSFEQVMRGLDHLREHGAEWNALCTIHAKNADRGREVYAFLRDECGARFMQFIPIVERVAGADLDDDGGVPWSSWRDRPLYRQEGTAVTSRSVTGEQYGRFLIDVFEDWVRRDIGEVFVQMFDVALANWVGAPPSLCVHAETCGRALALEHTGDLYSCDHFVDPENRLGNILELPMAQLVETEQQKRFGAAKRDSLPVQCLECDVLFACHGGCPKDRFIETASGDPGLNYLCDGYLAFFRHIDHPMRRMKALLDAGRAPSELVADYAAADASRGRNDPCTCGSGNKWKRCHGRPAAAGPSSADTIETT
ncbi:MAG: anaerobic sulfatase maturase [Thermoleophilaceae bacterium]|nr:anaerobic sulfatase maturase [Thermoleophilaceae bacterium]